MTQAGFLLIQVTIVGIYSKYFSFLIMVTEMNPLTRNQQDALFCDMTQETMDDIESKKNETMEELGQLTNPSRSSNCSKKGA